MACRSRDRCLNFNPFNISGGMRWGHWGEEGACRLPCFRKIPSLFLNDAWIYSQDAVLWHGMAGMSCFALPCFKNVITKIHEQSHLLWKAVCRGNVGYLYTNLFYTVSQKTCEHVFEDKLNKNCPFAKIFGTLITKTIGHQQVFLVSHLTWLVQLLYLGKLSRP